MHIWGPFGAYALSIPLALMPFIPLYLLPETAKMKKEDDGEASTSSASKKNHNLHERFREMKAHVQNELLPILKSVSIMIGMFSMLVGAFALAIGDIIMQYMKARFGWDYEKVSTHLASIMHFHLLISKQATHVIAFSAGLQIIFLTTVLPMAHKWLTNRFDARKSDLLLAKFSIFFDFLSTLMFGLSPEPVGAWICKSRLVQTLLIPYEC
jgi:hypothetical protein